MNKYELISKYRRFENRVHPFSSARQFLSEISLFRKSYRSSFVCVTINLRILQITESEVEREISQYYMRADVDGSLIRKTVSLCGKFGAQLHEISIIGG